MVMKKENLIFYVLIGLSIVSLFVSGFLVDEHYRETEGFCDFGEKVSCSYVNASIYSELFQVPVAFFGVIWSFILGGIAFNSIKDKERVSLLFVWSSLGVLTALYFIWAEFQLKAICPFCTVIHVITFLTLFISLTLIKKHKLKIELVGIVKDAKNWIIFLTIAVILTLIYYNLLR
jgi:uncharacterized membrane protein